VGHVSVMHSTLRCNTLNDNTHAQVSGGGGVRVTVVESSSFRRKIVTLQNTKSMGYASPKTIRLVIDRFRDQGLSFPLTVDSIQRIGVTESLAPRTIQTLKLLGLIDEKGSSTEQFEDLRRAATAEFKPKLVAILHSAYAPVFELLDPSVATYDQVQDAFRTFQPEGQRDRMVALFLGLLEYAEYSQDLPSGRAAAGTTRSPAAGRTTTPRPKKDRGADRGNNVNHDVPTPPPPRRPDMPPQGDPYRVELASGGTVFALIDVDLFALSTEDRDYVIDLVDKLKGYKTPGTAQDVQEESP
jgi:hypothetical protein